MRRMTQEMGELGFESVGGTGGATFQRMVEPGGKPQTERRDHAAPRLDRAEFAAALVDCLPRLQRTARRLAFSEFEAEDLVQETAVRGLEKLDQFVNGSASDAFRWLVTILRHINSDRRRKRRPEIIIDALTVPSDDGDPEAVQAWRLVDDGSVAEAIRSLPPSLRDPYLLFCVGRLPYSLIADRLKVSTSTVGTRIFRARERLRQVLAPASV